MKPTQEQIKKYITLYWGKRVVKIKGLRNGNDGDGLFTPWEYFLHARDYPYEIEYIQLRSIDSLTDEEVGTACEYLGCHNSRSLLKGSMNGTFRYSAPRVIETTDYLRSIGVETPYLGFSVEELKESGKLKLL